MLADLDAPHGDAAVLLAAEIAVGHGHQAFPLGGQKSDPAVDAIQPDGQRSALDDLVQQREEIVRLAAAVLLDPDAVHVQVQDGKAQVLGGFLGTQQRLAPQGRDGLVRFDAPELGGLVAHVAETAHQQHFQRGSPRLIIRALRVIRRQGKQVLLHRDPLLQQRLESARDQAGRKGRDAQVLGDGQFRGDVAVGHDAGVKRDEIDHAHVLMKALERLVNQPALVVAQQFVGGLHFLPMGLLPGDQHALLERG